jgi:phosphatidylethanolamine/phosphatidyl-N-methylethanolamine N-methyltransferase
LINGFSGRVASFQKKLTEVFRSMTTKQIESVYDFYARVYDFVFGKVLQSGREMAPALLELYPGARLLDVGVGTGLSLPLWSKHVDIVGIDLSEKMLDQAQKRVLSLEMSNVKLLRMDATKLDFPDNSFDRVLAAYFISTVPDPVRVVREMKRVCRPGGYLVFCNHFQSDNSVLAAGERLVSPIFSRLGFRTDLKLYELMDAADLTIETLEKIDFLGLWRAVRCINKKPATVPSAAQAR